MSWPPCSSFAHLLPFPLLLLQLPPRHLSLFSNAPTTPTPLISLRLAMTTVIQAQIPTGPSPASKAEASTTSAGSSASIPSAAAAAPPTPSRRGARRAEVDKRAVRVEEKEVSTVSFRFHLEVEVRERKEEEGRRRERAAVTREWASAPRALRDRDISSAYVWA